MRGFFINEPQTYGTGGERKFDGRINPDPKGRRGQYPALLKRGYRCLSALITFVLTFSLIFSPVASYAQVAMPTVLNLPVPGTMIAPSPAFVPVLLKGMTIHPDDPLKFDFIIDSGNTDFTQDEIKKESEKLVKYFLASMTVPKDDLWVNLSPYEKDRIIPNELGKTELGRDMLAQDYILKQLTASLMYPEEELGKKFWDKVYKKAEEQFGTSEIPVNTFNKVWILPEEATVYEHEQTVYVVNARLKVMLDSDYEALRHEMSNAESRADVGLDGAARDQVGEQWKSLVSENQATETRDDFNSPVAAQIIREVLIPAIEVEVNEGAHFAPLRQIYHSLILAKWYKETIKNSLLSQVYADKNLTDGVDVEDKDIKNQIYAQYMEAYKKGVFNYIKEDYDQLSQEIIPRKYFSGGLGLDTDVPIERIKKSSSPISLIKRNGILGKGFMLTAALVTAAALYQPPPVFAQSEGKESVQVSENRKKESKMIVTKAFVFLFGKKYGYDSKKLLREFKNNGGDISNLSQTMIFLLDKKSGYGGYKRLLQRFEDDSGDIARIGQTMIFLFSQEYGYNSKKLLREFKNNGGDTSNLSQTMIFLFDKKGGYGGYKKLLQDFEDAGGGISSVSQTMIFLFDKKYGYGGYRKLLQSFTESGVSENFSIFQEGIGGVGVNAPSSSPVLSDEIERWGVGTIWQGRKWPMNNEAYQYPDGQEIYAHFDGVFAQLKGQKKIMIDTAPAYSTIDREEYLSSEEWLGEYLRDHPENAKKSIIATKIGEEGILEGEGKGEIFHSADHLKFSVDRSINNLGRVDVLYLHQTSIGVLEDNDFMDAFRQMKKDHYGGIQYIGASISEADVLREASEKNLLDGLDVIQINGKVFLKNPDLMDQLNEKGIAIVLNSVGRFSGDQEYQEAYQEVSRDDRVTAILLGSRNRDHIIENIDVIRANETDDQSSSLVEARDMEELVSAISEIINENISGERASEMKEEVRKGVRNSEALRRMMSEPEHDQGDFSIFIRGGKKRLQPYIKVYIVAERQRDTFFLKIMFAVGLLGKEEYTEQADPAILREIKLAGKLASSPVEGGEGDPISGDMRLLVDGIEKEFSKGEMGDPELAEQFEASEPYQRLLKEGERALPVIQKRRESLAKDAKDAKALFIEGKDSSGNSRSDSELKEEYRNLPFMIAAKVRILTKLEADITGRVASSSQDQSNSPMIDLSQKDIEELQIAQKRFIKLSLLRRDLRVNASTFRLDRSDLTR